MKSMVERYDELVVKELGTGLARHLTAEVGRILVRCIEDDRLDREREAAAEKAVRAAVIAKRGPGITFNDRELP